MTIRLGPILAPCGWILTPVGAMLKTAKTQPFSPAWITMQGEEAKNGPSTTGLQGKCRRA